MRLFKRYLILASVIGPMPSIASAAVRYPPIHPERQKMSPADRRDAVMADLESILTSSTTPTSIATKPRLSSEEALCRRDVIQLAYPRTPNNRAWAAKPDGINGVSPEYHYLGYASDRSWGDWKKACEQLNGDKVAWVTASTDVGDSFVSDALGRLAGVVADVRKNPSVLITCVDIDGAPIVDLSGTPLDPTNSACPSAASFADMSSTVSNVRRCMVQGGECYGFTMGSWDVEITIDFSGGKRSTRIQLQQGSIR